MRTVYKLRHARTVTCELSTVAATRLHSRPRARADQKLSTAGARAGKLFQQYNSTQCGRGNEFSLSRARAKMCGKFRDPVPRPRASSMCGALSLAIVLAVLLNDGRGEAKGPGVTWKKGCLCFLLFVV